MNGVFIGALGLTWGSFLNMVAYRLLYAESFLKARSFCPHCKRVIAWYDLIPVISYLMLKGQCRACHISISLLYPFTEVLALMIGIGWWVHGHPITPLSENLLELSIASYVIFFSALLIATWTDFATMVIPQLVTIWLLPLGVAAAFTGALLPTGLSSIMGGVFGYMVLWVLAVVFRKLLHKEGVGVGDMELLALIGVYLGPLGVWATLLVASVAGSVVTATYLAVTGKKRNTHIPFAPFLSAGALVYFFTHASFGTYLFG